MERLRYIICGVLGILILGVTMLIAINSSYAKSRDAYSLFSWEDEVVLPEEREKLIDISRKLNIRTVYQAFSKEMLEKDETKDYLKDLARNGIKTYYLTGAPEWGLESRGSSLKKEIRLIAERNKTLSQNEKFEGLMVDIEPYLTAQWKAADDKSKEEYFKTYVKGMVSAYEVAKENNLVMIACIPTFYEAYSKSELEHLVAEGCDGLAVMNYNRENEIDQIKEEVRLTKKYNKPVIFISELQKPGYHSLENINTYYYSGLDVLKDSWKECEDWYGYSKLTFSYHYYYPLKEILKRDEGK